jgi:hypothetical protein
MLSLFYKLSKIPLNDSLRTTWPAFAVISATLIISIFIAEFTYVSGIKALWVVLLRFFRLLLILTLPLLMLSFVCKRINLLLNRGNGRLVQVPEMRDYILNPSKIWLIRPLQGIALTMLLASKLITVLQLYTHSIHNTVILPPSQFDPWRLAVVTIIVAVTSLMLSALWTLDDLGIRYCNSKTKEIKMAGKYLGLLLPVFFGFYGILNLFEQYEQLEAMQYTIQMVIIFYPAFLVFGVLHNYYIRKRESILLEQLGAKPYAITLNEKGMSFTRI